MGFNSYIFVLVLLPLGVLGYYCLLKYNKQSFINVYLLLLSIIFYAYGSIKHLFILFAIMAINYTLYKLLKTNPKLTLGSSIVFNLFALFYFKYFNFFINSINSFINLNFIGINVILPLAISFIVFSQISFIVDCYRNKNYEINLVEYMLYTMYFPKMIQGPIVEFNKFLIEIRKEKQFTIKNLNNGFVLFVLGLSKKMLIADVFGRAADYGFGHIDQITSLSMFVSILCYAIQIYFDFSGYSDMARGISKMFDIDLPINFNSPYKAISIADFWKRWHMSLTNFLTKYLYIPLGGNRKGLIRTYINILVVFLLSGLWHGPSYNYILWGLLNGLAMVFYRLFKEKLDRIPKVISWFFSMIFVLVCWTLFRANSFNDFLSIITLLFKFDMSSISSNILSCFNLINVHTIFDGIFQNEYLIYIYFLIAFIILCGRNLNSLNFEKCTLVSISISILFMYCLCCMSNISTYIYQWF